MKRYSNERSIGMVVLLCMEWHCLFSLNQHRANDTALHGRLINMHFLGWLSVGGGVQVSIITILDRWWWREKRPLGYLILSISPSPLHDKNPPTHTLLPLLVGWVGNWECCTKETPIHSRIDLKWPWWLLLFNFFVTKLLFFDGLTKIFIFYFTKFNVVYGLIENKKEWTYHCWLYPTMQFNKYHLFTFIVVSLSKKWWKNQIILRFVIESLYSCQAVDDG